MIKIMHILQRVGIPISDMVNRGQVKAISRSTTALDSTNERIIYEKGFKVRVQVMGDGNFRDVEQNRNFSLNDESAYRLVDEPKPEVGPDSKGSDKS
jgi:hypothetical protein